ncbi:MAG: phosphotransferase [Candidatus Sumerlaeaceae bacterium]|nr:phosphotransferase [Candidatus Sumerlaeaceae bacterium]
MMRGNREDGSFVSAGSVVTRAEVLPLVQEVLKHGQSGIAPDVYLIDWQGIRAVWKDYSRRRLWGKLWGKFVVARETRALARLRGLPGVPQVLTVVRPAGLVMEFLDGHVLPRKGIREKVSHQFFTQAFSLLAEIHARGVAHGDIRRKNIMVLRTGAPAFIDFQTAVLRSGRFWGNSLFRLMCKVDRWNLLRIKARSFPRYITQEEWAVLDHPPLLLRLGRFLRRRIYRQWKNQKHHN